MVNGGTEITWRQEITGLGVEGQALVAGYAQKHFLMLMIPLNKMLGHYLDFPGTSLTKVLKQRFEELNYEIRELIEQQRIIAGLLEDPAIFQLPGVMTKELWMSLLEHAGFSAADMRRWHICFEQTDPGKHCIFLEYLRIPADEIMRIRQWAAASQ